MKNLPIGMFGAVMGLVGLGLSARAAAPLFPGVVRAPAYVTEPWIAVGVLLFFALCILYLIKAFRFPAEVGEEFTHPLRIGFCGALPVASTLVAGGLAPYLPALASVVWWSGAVILVGLQVWAISRWLCGGVELAHVNGSWLILIVGGIVFPAAGIALGHDEAARFLLGTSGSLAVPLVGLLFYRMLVAPPLPEALRPTWFILLVPPSLVYAGGIALFPGAEFLESIFFAGLVTAAALLVYARGFLRWSFGPAWWAFTFPLDALAYAAVRYAQAHPSGPWRAVAAISLAVAAFFVLTVLLKQLQFLLATPRSASSPAG